jgi:hypothetical protein
MTTKNQALATSPPLARLPAPPPIAGDTEREFRRLAVRIGVERARVILSIIEAEHALLGPLIDVEPRDR